MRWGSALSGRENALPVTRRCWATCRSASRALDEVVAAALFLCDPANTYTTGQLLSVDGGWTAGYARNF